MNSRFVKQFLLKNFFAIDLTGAESSTVELAIEKKYVPVLRNMFLYALLITPAIILFPGQALQNILIPITMVTGSAWFAISLATMREKFENFGLELTTMLFMAFGTSLMLLFVIALNAFYGPHLMPLVEYAKKHYWVKQLAALSGVFVIGKLVYDVFVGALKFDVNDAMLAGQNEVAEKYFRRSLSLLHSAGEVLVEGKSLEVANYYLGVAFEELFSKIQSNFAVRGDSYEEVLEDVQRLQDNPQMSQEEADRLCVGFLRYFIGLCGNNALLTKLKLDKIERVLMCIEKKQEAQDITDARFAIILEDIAELLDTHGEELFKGK